MLLVQANARREHRSCYFDGMMIAERKYRKYFVCHGMPDAEGKRAGLAPTESELLVRRRHETA